MHGHVRMCVCVCGCLMGCEWEMCLVCSDGIDLVLMQLGTQLLSPKEPRIFFHTNSRARRRAIPTADLAGRAADNLATDNLAADNLGADN